MKIKITILTILIVLMTNLLGHYSDEYLLGAFVYNKNTAVWSGLHDPISTYLHDCGFNAGMCTSVYTSDPSGVTNMLGIMNSHGIDGILEDYTFDTSLPAYGARTLTMGNHQIFEAEYFNSSSITEDDRRHPDNYYYMSPTTNNNRIGSINDTTSAYFSNKYYWQLYCGQTGYAYRDLIFKWPVPNPTRYERIGPEFRFPKEGMADHSLFNTNELYITYAMKVNSIDALPGNTI